MAPTRTKKRKSTESEASMDGPESSVTALQARIETPKHTPTRKSATKGFARGMTVNQKQAFLDNLQLEITERARKLRAQYNLQAQGLRTRIEIRVNRIPVALRKATMGDLLMKYSESISTAALPTQDLPVGIRNAIGSPAKNLIQETQLYLRQSSSPRRPAKRTSDEMEDKENDDLPVKKRTKAAPAPERTTSRANMQSEKNVLSPRSANSRTLLRSPIRLAVSPQKSQLARPVSPLKPVAPTMAGGAAGILTSMVAKAKSTRANATRKVTTASNTSSSSGAGRGMKPAIATAAVTSRAGRGRVSDVSDSSEASTGTTVVTKPAAKQPPAKRTVMSTIKGMGSAGRKAAQPKAAPAITPAPAGRVLRKRN